MAQRGYAYRSEVIGERAGERWRHRQREWRETAILLKKGIESNLEKICHNKEEGKRASKEPAEFTLGTWVFTHL